MSFVFLEATGDQLSLVIQFDHNWSVQLSNQCAMVKCMQLSLYLWISICTSMIILHTHQNYCLIPSTGSLDLVFSVFLHGNNLLDT